MKQKEREIFDEWFNSQIMKLVRCLDSFTFTDKTVDERYEFVWKTED